MRSAESLGFVSVGGGLTCSFLWYFWAVSSLCVFFMTPCFMAFMTWVVCHFSACMGLVFSIVFSDLVMLAKRASYVLLNNT